MLILTAFHNLITKYILMYDVINVHSVQNAEAFETFDEILKLHTLNKNENNFTFIDTMSQMKYSLLTLTLFTTLQSILFVTYIYFNTPKPPTFEETPIEETPVEELEEKEILMEQISPEEPEEPETQELESEEPEVPEELEEQIEQTVEEIDPEEETEIRDTENLEEKVETFKRLWDLGKSDSEFLEEPSIEDDDDLAKKNSVLVQLLILKKEELKELYEKISVIQDNIEFIRLNLQK